MDPRTPDEPTDVLAPCAAVCPAPCAVPAGPSRRRVLALAALAGAGGAVLAACGGGSSGDSADPGDSNGASGDKGELVATSKVPVKGGVVLDAPKIVITQPAAG